MKNLLDLTPVLYGNCMIVKGSLRSVICDLEKNQVHYIPNDLYGILSSNKNKSINEIFKYYKNKYDNIIYDYFVFLKERNLIFFTKKPSSFISIDTSWYDYAKISNSVIDIDKYSLDKFEKIIIQLDKLDCKNLQIRFFENQEIEYIEKLLQLLRNKKSIINSIELVLKYNNNFVFEKLTALFEKFPRISNLILFKSPEDQIIQNPDNSKQIVKYSTNNLHNIKDCGKVRDNMFAINIKNFTESLSCNSCLNGKISIDAAGNIKNCPSMPQSFGNINNTTLQEALEHPDFKKYWNVTKDQVAVCKDCEFRYICTDCRAYTERTTFNEEGLDLSKPLKCGYNPYTNEWAEWSTNPLKQKAIEYYGMQDLVKKDA